MWLGSSFSTGHGVTDAEGDRLSILSDDLILKILSFVGTKDVIRTSVLSHRWRYVWTSIPHLTFSSENFSTLDKLTNFVTNVLSGRNNRAELSSLNLYLRLNDGYDVAHRLMNYAFSHNVQQVNLSCLFRNSTCFPNADIEFSLSLSRSQTLKHLTYRSSYCHEHIALTSASELSSLTTLHLDYITLYDGFFSKCPNLENLTLFSCRMLGSDVFRISHPRLSNLTVDHGDLFSFAIDVVTPQLKHLTITRLCGSYVISAPMLASLVLSGSAPFMFSTDGLNSLEKTELYLKSLHSRKAPSFINLLQNLRNVKYFSLSMDIIQFLNLEVELILHQPSPFANLKSLKIFPRVRCVWKGEHVRVVMSTEVKNYLLNSSPEATVTEVLSDRCCDSRGASGLICKQHKTGKWF